MTAPRHGFNTTAITHSHKQHWIADMQVMHIADSALENRQVRATHATPI